MAFLGMLSSGLGLLGSLDGLLSGNSAVAAAEKAENEAIVQFESAANQDYINTATKGNEGLLTLSGGLDKALAAHGRALGAAEAGAGVYGSTAVAGAIANEAAQDSATLGSYSTNVADTLARMKEQSLEEGAQMKLGFAQNNLNYARQQLGGAEAGTAKFLGQLGQTVFGGTGAQGTTMGQTGSVLTPGMDYPVGQPYGQSGYQLPNNYYENRF